MARIFGDIEGQPEGSQFADRKALAQAGVHRPLQASISGSANEGADSIVVNGGYEDDEDYGNLIVYTGAGGRDPNSGKQFADQEFKAVNAALAKNCTDGLPVRVVRGPGTTEAFRTQTGYRYDGIYRVDEYWVETGKSGFKVCRFRLLRQDAIPELEAAIAPVKVSPRKLTSIQRIVRSSDVARRVKELHGYRCQVCGVTLETPPGPYAEGAHIRPLGRPHDGPDVEANILCLCPNDHVRLDCLAITILDNLQIIAVPAKTALGQLIEVKEHRIDRGYLEYHRKLCGL